ncbi:uncharacterized protein LOC130646342 [Hydractinia symbiolongicarpus]|uniref:uncharacterized protein LOC130646342 n=1 Tax=Hydractinia symbiolongicarpus TaxID=13093 RepID=UPI002549EF64|nr:uncharacterized protein LOC130646342 [Hydractinia symbiolongicarpus]
MFSVSGLVHSMSYDTHRNTLYYARWSSTKKNSVDALLHVGTKNQQKVTLLTLNLALAVEYEPWFQYLFIAAGSQILRYDTRSKTTHTIVTSRKLAFVVTVDPITEKVFWIDQPSAKDKKEHSLLYAAIGYQTATAAPGKTLWINCYTSEHDIVFSKTQTSNTSFVKL